VEPKPVVTPLVSVKQATVLVHAAAPARPVRHRVARPKPAPEVVATEPERTVKEGRIVDPFAGLK
jgi:hypothetical protein